MITALFEGVKHVIYFAGAFDKQRTAPLIVSTLPANRIALRIYNIVIPLAALLLYWFRLRRLPLLNQFIAYIVLCVSLPYVSGDYTLVHMYIAWAAFLLFLLSMTSRQAGSGFPPKPSARFCSRVP